MISILIFFLGASLGSFFMLVVDRYGTKQSIIFSSSICPNCQSRLTWWQNIPLISYLVLRGKCSFCNSKISLRYFLSELVTGLIFLSAFFYLSSHSMSLLKAVVFLFFILALTLLSFFDIKHRIVPHSITYSSIGLILICIIFMHESSKVFFFNLGTSFLFMDFMYLFSALLKKFKIQPDFISIPLILWSLSFFFFSNLKIALTIALIYLFCDFFLARVKQVSLSDKVNIFIWIILFFVLSFHCFNILFLTFNYERIVLLSAGAGIIYFVCEIISYFLVLLTFKSKISTNFESDSLQIAIGGGDVTIFALISVFLGIKLAFLVLFIASLLALISHFTLKALRIRGSKFIPFVPYLSIACFIIIMTIYGNS